MFTVIPVLPVEESCHWCEPQKCYTASLWWGRCLLSFYTTDADRLEAERLNDTAQKVLIEVTKAVKPESDVVIDGEEMWDAIGNAGCLFCYWPDFVPALVLLGSSSVCIPEPTP